jgi:hypothetical protein
LSWISEALFAGPSNASWQPLGRMNPAANHMAEPH